MKKLFIWIFNYTNPTPQERASLLFSILKDGTTTEHQVITFDNLEKKVIEKMEKRKDAIQKEEKAIDFFLKYPELKEPSKILISKN